MGRKTLRDRVLSRQAGEAGMGLVADNNEDWMDEASLQIMLMPADWTGTGEDLRFHLIEETNVGEPKKPQAWGALINANIKAGFLEVLSLDGRMRVVSSHYRRTPIYRIPTKSYRRENVE